MAIKGIEKIDYIKLIKYGPGKFRTNIDEYFYEISMDGVEEQVGSTETTGWFGLLLFEEDPVVVDDEIIYGAIVFENSDGFIEVELFDNPENAANKWLELEEELSHDDEEEE